MASEGIQLTWRKTLFLIGSLGAFVAFFVLSGNAPAMTETASTAPSIVSDQEDYAPGSTVTLTGANWGGGESVHIVVNDDAGQTWSYSADVTADEAGNLTKQFQLPDWFVANYTVTATGSSGAVATATFTDAIQTTTTIVSSLNPSLLNQSLTFTATVTCSLPCAFDTSHAIDFKDGANANNCNGGTILGTVTGANFTGTGNSRQAQFSTSSLAAGTHSIMACFNGGGPNPRAGASNSAPLSQVVTATPADATVPAAATISINAAAAWTNSASGAVTLSFSATDNVGVTRYRLAETQAALATATDVAVSPAEASFSRSGVAFTLTGGEAAAKAVWLRVCDASNNCSDANDTIGWDKTPPTITFTSKTGANANGWNNGNVTVNWSCADTLSGPVSATTSQTVTTEGLNQSATGTCTDAAGNSASNTQGGINIDTTPPTITASATVTGGGAYTSGAWTNKTVTVHFECSDGPSGLAGPCPADVVVSSDTSAAGHDISGSVTDRAGNSATSNTINVKVDKTPPTSAATAGSATVTNASPFTINYTASDPSPGSGLDKVELWVKVPGGSFVLAATDSSPAASGSFSYTPLAGEGTYSFYTRAADEAGNVEVPPGAPDAQVTVLLDQTAPVTTDDADAGWHSAAVTVHLSASDGPAGSPSGVASTHFSVDGGGDQTGLSVLIAAPADHSNDGSHTISYHSVDNAGNIEAAKSATVKIDTTKPTVACGVSDGLWHNAEVSIACTATDGGSGLATASDASFSLVTAVGPGNEDGNASTGSRTVTDVAGNSETAGPISGNMVDRKAPTLTITCPATPIAKNSSASASWTASDGGSGLATPASGSVVLDTSSVGPQTANAPTAKDKVGNETNRSCAYSVIFGFHGFFQPVDMNKLNGAQAGSAIPVKFDLSGNQGLSIFALGWPLSVKIACDTAAELDLIEETVTAGGSSLNYDAGANAPFGQYTYVWKTDKAWSSSCRRLDVKFMDGTVKSATFQFKK